MKLHFTLLASVLVLSSAAVNAASADTANSQTRELMEQDLDSNGIAITFGDMDGGKNKKKKNDLQQLKKYCGEFTESDACLDTEKCQFDIVKDICFPAKPVSVEEYCASNLEKCDTIEKCVLDEGKCVPVPIEFECSELEKSKCVKVCKWDNKATTCGDKPVLVKPEPTPPVVDVPVECADLTTPKGCKNKKCQWNKTEKTCAARPVKPPVDCAALTSRECKKKKNKKQCTFNKQTKTCTDIADIVCVDLDKKQCRKAKKMGCTWNKDSATCVDLVD